MFINLGKGKKNCVTRLTFLYMLKLILRYFQEMSLAKVGVSFTCFEDMEEVTDIKCYQLGPIGQILHSIDNIRRITYKQRQLFYKLHFMV